jgi:hypothetical protein
MQKRMLKIKGKLIWISLLIEIAWLRFKILKLPLLE